MLYDNANQYVVTCACSVKRSRGNIDGHAMSSPIASFVAPRTPVPNASAEFGGCITSPEAGASI